MIQYDTPIEVTMSQYAYLIREYSGALAHRTENGKYYIKVWMMRYASEIADYLKLAA